MKDLHIKLDNGSGMILEELSKYYDSSMTDIISSLLELANNAILNNEFQNYVWKQFSEGNEDNDWLEDLNYLNLFQYLMECATNNRK